MPETTVKKMIDAITILVSLMKPLLSALIQSFVATCGASQPRIPPSRIGYENPDIKYRVERFLTGFAVPYCGCRSDHRLSPPVIASL